MTINEIPVVSFFKRLVDPCIVLSTLYVLMILHGQVCTGYDVALFITAYFVFSYIYEHVELTRAWRSGRFVAYAANVVIGWILVVATIITIGYATDLMWHYSPTVLLTWFATAPLALIGSHLIVRWITSRLRQRGQVRSVAIIGVNEAGMALANIISSHPNLFMDVRGFFDDRSETRLPAPPFPLLGATAEIAAYVRQNNINLVFISLPMSAQPRIMQLVDDLHDTTASVYFVPDVNVFDIMQARFDDVCGVPVVAVCETPFTGLNSVIKRMSDLLIAFVIQLLLLPVMLGIAVAVKLSSPGPVIFKQRRYGLNGESIIVYKFRSMTVCEDGKSVVQAQKNDQRVTRLGAFLRRSSLDELPQLINVLQGRMSLVGPRPHAVSHNEMYRKLIKGYMLRHKAKPGITGWAQVNGFRGETETLDKMRGRIELDLEYLRSWSLLFDLWIILRTIKVVLKRENAY